MKRLPGLLLLATVVACGARGSAIAIENSQDHSQGVASGATGGASGISAIRKTMAAEQLALGDPVLNGLGMVLVPIPAGEFQMGSPAEEKGREYDETLHPVRITQPFYLGVREVTRRQYERVMGPHPGADDVTGETKPVTKVSWNSAVQFCRKLSEQEGQEYRLPTEAEWEFACRAATTTAYSFGHDATRLGQYAWHAGNSSLTAHVVAEKPANGWGLYDMHGNVWEWCQDWLGSYPSGGLVVDPAGPAEGAFRVLRGGSFFSPARDHRSANRNSDRPPSRYSSTGFRLARTYQLSP